jgi:hypothetical protein
MRRHLGSEISLPPNEYLSQANELQLCDHKHGLFCFFVWHLIHRAWTLNATVTLVFSLILVLVSFLLRVSEFLTCVSLCSCTPGHASLSGCEEGSIRVLSNASNNANHNATGNEFCSLQCIFTSIHLSLSSFPFLVMLVYIHGSKVLVF